MGLDLKEFQKKLAHQKVYDAWQYVDSLREMINYMNLSYQLLENVHKTRRKSLKKQETKILQEVKKKENSTFYAKGSTVYQFKNRRIRYRRYYLFEKNYSRVFSLCKSEFGYFVSNY